jgi:septal ring factor EnvC (AmiA/AmiB activator)
MRWYDAGREFLYVHPWLQGLIFASLAAIAGGGSFLHRRKERKHAKDLVEANQKIAETNQQTNNLREEANRLTTELLSAHQDLAEANQRANTYREEANTLNAELLKVHREVAIPQKEKLRPRLLEHKGKIVMFLRESYRGSYEPAPQMLLDANEDSVIFLSGGPGGQPFSYPLIKITTETDAQGRFMVVFDDGATPRISRR